LELFEDVGITCLYTDEIEKPVFSSLAWVNEVPDAVWRDQIYLRFFTLKEMGRYRRVNTFFDKWWTVVMQQNAIHVPQGCPTLEKAMKVAVVFSERKEYTAAQPLEIRLEQGVHEIVDDGDGPMHVACSHITFVGKGKDQTTIRGGFKVDNQQNVKFEGLTITNQLENGNGHGLYLRGHRTTVDMLKCALKECDGDGMFVEGGATVTSMQCEFMENSGDGVGCSDANTKARLNDCTIHHNETDGLNASTHAVVDLLGANTNIHSNKDVGMYATDDAKVNIHLSSEHNTAHDNRNGNKTQTDGGSIANMNADGTFTHVVAREDFMPGLVNADGTFPVQ